MKTKNIFKGLSLALVAFAAMATTSCKDEPDAYEIQGGKPTISFIRPVSASAKDSIISAASMQSTICIVGENLRSVTSLLFNDQEAVLNTSYMTDNTLIVTVPNEIPNTVTDKIYFATRDKDTVTYNFHVIIPAPVVSSMSNEWAEAGEEVTIVGDYFLDYADFPVTVNFGDNYTLPRSAISSISKTKIVFTMPADAPEEKISVTSIYGTTAGGFKYKDTRGMLFDFDTPCSTGTVLGNNGWHNRDIQSDDTSLKGNYLLLGGAAMGDDGGWNDGNFSFEYWCGDWEEPQAYSQHPRIFDVADFTDFANKSLKFELNIPESNAWSAAPMQIYFGSVEQVSLSAGPDIYGHTCAGANNTFFHEQGKLSRALYMPWKDNDNLLFHTGGKWITVTIPISDFIYDWDGNKITSTYLSEADFANFNIFVVKGGYNDKSVLPTGVACNPLIKIDNIRVVPNK